MSCRGAADLQSVAKGPLVLQADGCDDGELQGAWGEHVGCIPGTAKTRLYNSNVHLQEPNACLSLLSTRFPADMLIEPQLH